MDTRPLSASDKETQNLPILIVDKKGFVGKGLARLFREKTLTVLVTGDDGEGHDNIIHISYERKIPIIPDNLYAGMFVVYNGEKEILDMMTSLLTKAEESGTKLTFVTALEYSSKRLFLFLHNLQSSVLRVVVYGETFSDRNKENNEINYIIHQAKVYGRIELPHAGLGKLYPVLYEDMIEGIAGAAFGEHNNHHLYYIFPSYPLTQIAIARMLQKHHPLLKIDFTKKKYVQKAYYVPGGGVYMYPQYSLEAKLQTLNLSPVKDIPQMPQKKLKLKVSDPDVSRRRWVIFSTLLFSLFIAPVIVTFFFAICGAGLLNFSLKAAEAGNLETAKQSAILAHYSFDATEALIPGLVLPVLVAPTQTAQVLENIGTAKEVVGLEEDGLTALQLIKNIYNQKSSNPKNDFLQALAILKNTLLTYQKMKAEDKLPQAVFDKMQKYTGVLQLVEGTIDTWPELLGFEGQRSYLVLFQNNMELRPGGGFIGSYGTVSVQNGVFGKLQIHDVYDADGKLKTHIDPPYGLQRYLGSAHWFLRDSNFAADFNTNAQKARQFLKLETGERVDGVVAIDTTFLKNLLSVLGSVTVSDSHTVVTPDNFYLLTQTNAEKNFFPGSTQKKDFLRSLTAAMIEKFINERKFSYDRLLQSIETSIRSKHLMFGFADAGVQNVFTVNGLSSSLAESRIHEKNTTLDFFSVIDANVGANKANYYVKRSITHNVRFDSAGGLQETAEVNYNNASTINSPFGGDYKNYVRFLLPISAEVQHVYIDSKEQDITLAVTDPGVYTAHDFVNPTSLEVAQTETFGKKEVGFFLITPVNASKNVTISYRIPQAVNLDAAAFTYKLLAFKQPGTDADPYNFTFSYPSDFQVIKTEDNAVNLGGKFTIETNLDIDRTVSVILSKK